MAENKNNPSVVSNESVSNYNLGRSELGKADLSMIEELDKQMKKGPGMVLPRQTIFPGADRGIQVGMMYNRTLGQLPIFAAGQGLMPLGILEAKRQSEYQGMLDRFAMFGPENNEILDQYVELVNPWAQGEFNEKLQNDINSILDGVANETGGDYAKARTMLKYMPEYQQMLRGYKDYARAYNAIAPQAFQVLEDSMDPAKYVDDATLDMAMKLVQNHDQLSGKPIGELLQYVNKFKAQLGLNTLAQNIANDFGSRVETRLEEMDPWSTDYARAIKQIETEGFVTDSELLQYVDDLIESSRAFSYLKDDPEAKSRLMRMVKMQLDKKKNETLISIRKQSASFNSMWNSQWGGRYNNDGDIVPDQIDVRDGEDRRYNTNVFHLPERTPGGRQVALEIQGSPTEPVTVVTKTGEQLKGYFGETVAYIPNIIYNTTDATQEVKGKVSSSLQAGMYDDMGNLQRITKGPVTFWDLERNEPVKLSGEYDVMVNADHVDGQLRQNFGRQYEGAMFKLDEAGYPSYANNVTYVDTDGKMVTTSRVQEFEWSEVRDKATDWADDRGVEYDSDVEAVRAYRTFMKNTLGVEIEIEDRRRKAEKTEIYQQE